MPHPKKICNFTTKSPISYRSTTRSPTDQQPDQPGPTHTQGSGGFMGYWGLFSEAPVGRYVAYHGKSSDCFLIRLDNGDKYLLGCQHPDAMTAHIKSLIQK